MRCYCDLHSILDALPPSMRTPVLIIAMFTLFGGTGLIQVWTFRLDVHPL